MSKKQRDPLLDNELKTIEIQSEIKKEVKEKKPLSMIIINTGLRPVVIDRNRSEIIVIHPFKTMRIETEKALALMKKFPTLEEYKK